MRPDVDRPGRLTSWLREAVRAGQVGDPWLGDFPRYAWYRQGNNTYEAMLVNKDQGQYKGYLLSSDEWPEGLR